MKFIYDEENNKIKLELDAKLLQVAFDCREDALGKIKKNKIKDFMKKFVELANGMENQDTGLTPFQEVFDNIFYEMETDDCDFIKCDKE